MKRTTKIEWAHHTFNPWLGCQHVSPGCENCYAETLANRFNKVTWGPGQERKRTSTKYWAKPGKWDREAKEEGVPHRVFCASMADVFDNNSPPGAREDLWDLIHNTPHLLWLILTKRPQNIREGLPDNWPDGFDHVWLGITAEDQQEYDRRWPVLAPLPATVKFISYEPAIGPLTLKRHTQKPDWLIWGGESGQNPRPLDTSWARSITQECLQAGIPVFGKQWGTYANNLLVTEKAIETHTAKLLDPPENGKGGAVLDGRLHRQFPAQHQEHQTRPQPPTGRLPLPSGAPNQEQETNP